MTDPAAIDLAVAAAAENSCCDNCYIYNFVCNHIVRRPSLSSIIPGPSPSPPHQATPIHSVHRSNQYSTNVDIIHPTPNVSDKYLLRARIPDYNTILCTYFKNSTVSEEDFQRAQNSWNSIVNNTTAPFIINSGLNTIHETNSLSWFVHIYEKNMTENIMIYNPYKICNNELIRFIEFILAHKHKTFDEIQFFIRAPERKKITYQDYLFIKDAIIHTLEEILGLSKENDIIISWEKVYNNFLYTAFTTYV